MPNLDQTGPTGQGPMTGRGQGVDAKQEGGEYERCVRSEMQDNGLSQEEAKRVCSYLKKSGEGSQGV